MESMMTATATAAMASATGHSMAGMNMGGGCKISMLWNWNTVGACFISSQWRITSKSMFAGSCIGVILLVMSLEFLRRLSREYDRYVLAERIRYMGRLRGSSSASNAGLVEEVAESTVSTDRHTDGKTGLMARDAGFKTTTTIAGESKDKVMIRPTLLQQLIRAGIHMVTFAVAYFVMLLAMYYNGYFIICILIGAFIGAFIFSWETVGAGNSEEKEVTGCCG